MEKLNKNIYEIWQDSYVVPLYQRNFSWGENEIGQLIQDIYENSSKSDSNYYIGSLVTIQRTDGTYEVIDGQQRLTTLHLLCKYLGVLSEAHLRYDSRPEVESFFQDLFGATDVDDFLDDSKRKGYGKVYRLVDALDIIGTTEIHPNICEDNQNTFTLKQIRNAEDSRFSRFAEYLNSHVIIVHTVLPSDTDVAAYFEIMNNRGEQLQEHEIIKALLLDKIADEKKKIYADIWDACSQMNVPIQKALSNLRLNEQFPLFGENYDDFQAEFIDKYVSNGEYYYTPLSIDEILENSIVSKDVVEDINDEDSFETIIDFPNLLMLLFKIDYEDVPLNANVLLDTFDAYFRDIDAAATESLIKRLLQFRVLFDRYVVKNQGQDDDENLKWVLVKPRREYIKSSVLP